MKISIEILKVSQSSVDENNVSTTNVDVKFTYNGVEQEIITIPVVNVISDDDIVVAVFNRGVSNLRTYQGGTIQING